MKQGNPPSPVLPKWPPASSLRRTLLVWMGAGTLVIVLLIALSATYVAFEAELANWKALLGDESRENAKSLAVSLQATRDELSLVGLLDPSYVQSRPEILASFQKQNRALVEVLRTDANGTVLAGANQDKPVLSEQGTISQASWFRAAAAGQPALEVVQASPVDDSYLVITVPAADGGVVVGRLRMDVLEGTVRRLDLGPTGSAMIKARDGRVLAHTDPRLVFTTVNGGALPEVGALPPAGDAWVASYRDLTGQDMLAAFASVSGTDWTMIVQVSHGQIFAASRNALLTLAGALLGLTLIGSLFLWQILIRLVFRPIQELREGVERIGLGDLGYRIDVGRRDEIGIVAEAVNQMAGRVHERDEQIAVSTQALRESETRLRRIADSMQDMISEIDMKGNILYASPSHRDVLGYAAEELIGRSVLEHVHPDDRSQAISALDRTLKSGAAPVAGIFRCQHADGHYVWLECMASMISESRGQVTGMVLCSRDITGRKEMEVALLESEARYRAIVEDQAELICRAEPGGTLTFVNEAYCRYFGQSREELVRGSFLSLVPEDDRSLVQQCLASLSQSKPSVTYEHRVILPDGGLRWQQRTDRALFDPRGNLGEYASVARDITDRKLTEVALRQLNQELEQRVAERTSALRQSEERLRAIMDSAKDAIVAADNSGRLVLWNRAAETMFGYTAAEALGQSADLIIPDRFRGSMRGAIARWSQIEEGLIRRTFEGTALRKDGKEFPVETSLAGWSSQG